MTEIIWSFDSIHALFFSASRALCSPFAVFIQIQGCVICLLLAAGWAGAAYVRNREIRQMKKCMKEGNDFPFLSHDIHDLEHSKQIQLPGVTVVMPLKGFGEHNLHNWRTQLTSLYGGPLEFLFVVDSTDDPAYHAVSRLLLDFKDDVDARIVVAGPSTTCSQKIHNQLVGVEKMHKGSKYVLFLDDDVRLHPGSVGALTAEMEKNPEIFIQTGYPLDLPSGSLGSYCIYEYHMMHADDFRTDKHGVVSELRDGGYSDDMTLAAIAGAHKRLITSPPVAVLELFEKTNVRLGVIHNKYKLDNESGIIFCALLPILGIRLILVGCLVICTGIELLSMWNLTRIEVRLCNMLSPEAPPLSLSAYNWCLVFVAMVVDNFLYPISAIRSHFSQSINWSGIRYHLRNGKIHKIERTMEKGKKFSDLAAKRLYGRKGAQSKISILGSLSRSLAHWRQPKKYDV
ncbi:Ceramide glucosyltransferase [Cynara cardunculus var. scolymus]|uniref:ceramide glucosyltransferase n=1 Tax=Cynara cardunculus var. scolymus TaxID=59895 RepID=A0A118K0H9_CYNCS|nr:Ceramide glucosyltransferase [Cynara cardunculus var. scolymus]